MRFTNLFAAGLALIGLAATMSAQVAASAATNAAPDRGAQIRELRQELDRIAARLSALEAEERASTAAPALGKVAGEVAEADGGTAVEMAGVSTAASSIVDTKRPELTPEDMPALRFWRGTTVAVGVDGYFGYNFNEPVGRVNLLRAYDVTSNSFNLSQASLVLEHLPSARSRFGGRVDLQFGQATDAGQGSPLNEQRPQVWRNLFQAYGSYLAPIGSGLRLDFGKWADSLGSEGNYTKDQVAYSRSYSFGFLPFYHMGLRASYDVSPRVNVAYWLVNGANQSEDLNPWKSQAFLFTLKPTSKLGWNVNYYFGQEGRAVEPTLNPGLPTSPVQAGLPTANISPAPNGREHIFDTSATWDMTSRLSLTGQADFVVNRNYARGRPTHVVIGGLTARYALRRDWNIGARAEYFDDRGGLFSGQTQALKEATAVLDHRFAPGFVARAEFRRDWSNRNYFLSDTAGELKRAQSTATLGLIYWWGTKQGNW